MLSPVLALLREKQRFIITTHVRPDGDAIGSQLALGLFLQKLGKDVALVNSDPAPDNLAWLPGLDAIEVFTGKLAQRRRIAEADAILVVDTNTLERLGKVGKAVAGSPAAKVLIDHHTEPETWFDLAYARDTASSTGELVFEIIAAHDAELIDETMATALYAAILTDTGSFRYSSVTPAVHRIVAELMERGQLSPDVIYTALYESRTPESLRLLARVLDTLTLAYDGQVSYLVIAQRMLKETGASSEETEGFVGYGLSVEGVKAALIFTETAHGTKVSFRSQGAVYVNEWARAFGGGGHRNASGAFVQDTLDAVIDAVVAAAPKFIDLERPEDETITEEDADYLATLLDLKAQK